MEPILKSLSTDDLNALRELLAEIASADANGAGELGITVGDPEDVENAQALARIARHIRNNCRRVVMVESCDLVSQPQTL